MTDAESWVSVARVLRPQGRRGEVLAEILTDFPERFTQMREAFLRRNNSLAPTPIFIEEAWLHKGRVVLKLAKVDSISDAELLRGAEVVIPMEARMRLEEDAAYISELIGCELIDLNQPDRAVVGIVRDVMQQEKTADLLIVTGSDGTEHWIPFVKAYLERIDLPGRRLEMHLPVGLLEVNAPLSDEERQERQNEAEAALLENSEEDSLQ